MTWVTLDHLIGGLEAGVSDLSDSQLFMISLLCRDNRSVGREGEVYPWVGYQVSLELCQVHVQGSIKTQGGRDGRHYLTNQPVTMCCCFNVVIQWS